MVQAGIAEYGSVSPQLYQRFSRADFDDTALILSSWMGRSAPVTQNRHQLLDACLQGKKE
jgi:hypothetical protein